jgi:hypothetical protein
MYSGYPGGNDGEYDSASIVAESYLSNYHVHKQTKPHGSLSAFQLRLTEFTDGITRLGTIRKLIQIITNGIWLPPLQCAQEAVNEAGETDIPFVLEYRELVASDDNDVENVPDQNVLRLRWLPEANPSVPGSLFLYRICMMVLKQVLKILFPSHRN